MKYTDNNIIIKHYSIAEPSAPRKEHTCNSLIYHVFNRGINRHSLFNQESDKEYFKQLLTRYGASNKMSIYHWVIMSNHYHLMVEIAEPLQLSPLFAGIGRAYTHYYHRTYGTSGYLWESRFKTQAIDTERYLLECARYIERNPVKVRMVKEAHEYKYSSAGYYVKGDMDELTTCDPEYLLLGDTDVVRQSAYRQWLQGENEQDENLFGGIEKSVGCERFKATLLKVKGIMVSRRKYNRSQKKNMNL